MTYSLGYIPNKEDIRDYKYSIHISTNTVEHHEIYMPRVKNQGRRGSCVAFACCAVLEYQIKGFRKYDLSEEMLYRMIAEPGGGSYPRNAMKALSKIGTSREKFWKYNYRAHDPISTRYMINWRDHRRAYGDARKFKIGEYRILGGFEDMKSALIIFGPIVVGLTWDSDWFQMNPNSEEIQGLPVLDVPIRSSMAGGHMVCICGFTYVRDSLYFKIRNSWGRNWGMNGYAWISASALSFANYTAWTFTK